MIKMKIAAIGAVLALAWGGAMKWENAKLARQATEAINRLEQHKQQYQQNEAKYQATIDGQSDSIAQLQDLIDQERLARTEAVALNLAITQRRDRLAVELEALKNHDPITKAWADTVVSPGAIELLNTRYATYQGDHRNQNREGDSTGELSDPMPGPDPPNHQ